MIYPSPGYISEVVTIFLATGLSPASGERDEDEAIEMVRVLLAELDESLPRIRDASTLIALMALPDRRQTTGTKLFDRSPPAGNPDGRHSQEVQAWPGK